MRDYRRLENTVIPEPSRIGACSVMRLGIRDLRKFIDVLRKIPDKWLVSQAKAWTHLLSGMTKFSKEAPHANQF